jgi:hypothetical protein
MSLEQGERRYTLEEAKRELNREECHRYGHRYEVTLIHGKNEPTGLYCERCGRMWKVEAK